MPSLAPPTAAGGSGTAAGSSTLLPTITASLRGEFIPLLKTLEQTDSFTGASYMIELIFALVRLDSFLKHEERNLFVRAFNHIIGHLFAKHRKLCELQRRLRENRDYLSGLVERCSTLEEMAEMRARGEASRQAAAAAAQQPQQQLCSSCGRAPLTAAASEQNDAEGDGETALTACMSEAPVGQRLGQDSFCANPPSVLQLSFAPHTGQRLGDDSSMTERHAELQHALRSSLRRRVQHGLSHGSWTVPANLSDLARVNSCDCLVKDGEGYYVSSSVESHAPGPLTDGPRNNGNSSKHENSGSANAYRTSATSVDDVARMRRRLSGSTLPPLLPPEPPAATAPSALSNPSATSPYGCHGGRAGLPAMPYYPTTTTLPEATATDGSCIRNPHSPAAATVEGLWEASFWALLNGAEAAADVELLYGLLSAHNPLKLTAGAGTAGRGGKWSGAHGSSQRQHHAAAGGRSAPAHGSFQQQQRLWDACHDPSRLPSQETASAVLDAVSNGTAEPSRWQLWFTILAVLTVLTDSFVPVDATIESRDDKQSRRQQHRGPDGESEQKNDEMVGLHGGRSGPPSPAASLRSGVTLGDDDESSNDSVRGGRTVGGGGPGHSNSTSAGGCRHGATHGSRNMEPLKEASPDALLLLQQVFCPSLANRKIGLENVRVAAPVLAARAAAPHSMSGGFGRRGGSGGEDSPASIGKDSHTPVQHQQPLPATNRRQGHQLSSVDFTASVDAVAALADGATGGGGPSPGSASLSPDSFAFPVDLGTLSEGDSENIRPVDVILHALITALEVQLNVAATAGTSVRGEGGGRGSGSGDRGTSMDPGDADADGSESSACDSYSGHVDAPPGGGGLRRRRRRGAATATAHPSPSRGEQPSVHQWQRSTASTRFAIPPDLSFASAASACTPSSSYITALLQRSFSSAAYTQSPAPLEANATAAAATAATCAQGTHFTTSASGFDGWFDLRQQEINLSSSVGDTVSLCAPNPSIPAIMRSELTHMLENVCASLETVTRMAAQLKSEASLLAFRVVSTVLDWLIPAAYLVDHRIWLFYRVWVCDLYALFHREGLMQRFNSILDQEVEDGGGNTNTARVRDSGDGSHGTAAEGTPAATAAAAGVQDAQSAPGGSGRNQYSDLGSDLTVSKAGSSGEEQDDVDIEEEGNSTDSDGGQSQRAACRNPGIALSPTTGALPLEHADPFELVVPGSCVRMLVESVSPALVTALVTEAATAGSVSSSAAFPLLSFLATDTTTVGRGTTLIISRSTQLNSCAGDGLSVGGCIYRIHHCGVPLLARSLTDKTEGTVAAGMHSLLTGTTAAVRAAQALLDDGTYIPLPQGFMVSRIVAAAVRGMDPGAVRSLLAPFCHTRRRHGRGRGPRGLLGPSEVVEGEERSAGAQRVVSAGGDNRDAAMDDGSECGTDHGAGGAGAGADADPVYRGHGRRHRRSKQGRGRRARQRHASTAGDAAGIHDGTDVSPNSLNTALTAATIASTPGGNPVMAAAATGTGDADGGSIHSSAPATSGMAVRSRSQSLGESSRMAQERVASRRRYATAAFGGDGSSRSGVSEDAYSPAVAGSPRNAFTSSSAPRSSNQQGDAATLSPTAKGAAADGATPRTESPALVHHHRYRYPVVNSVLDVGELYVNTLREAEVMLSPHDPLRAALVQSVVDFYLVQMDDPARAASVLDSYLDDVEEEPVQAPVLQPAAVLGDSGVTNTGAAGPGANANSAAAVAAPTAAPSAFSVTSVRHSQAKQSPSVPMPSSAATPAALRSSGGGLGPVGATVATVGTLPLVPIVIPSWGTQEEHEQFMHVLAMLRSTQELLRSKYHV